LLIELRDRSVVGLPPPRRPGVKALSGYSPHRAGLFRFGMASRKLSRHAPGMRGIQQPSAPAMIGSRGYWITRFSWVMTTGAGEITRAINLQS